jgi:transposase InsO family protein
VGPSVPRAFDDPTETTQTDERDEPIETITTNESSEIPGEFPEEEEVPEEDQSPSEPSVQLQAELAVRMTSSIPEPKEAKPMKLVQFDIPNLTKQNVRTWKSDVQEFCEIQGVWEVVVQTLRRQEKPEELQQLLEKPMWASQDATARYYIKKNIQQEDKTSVRDLKNSGAVWKYLMNRYERTTEYDTVILVQTITQWKKDPKIDIETSLQHLEQLNADLYEVSNQKHKFDELMILTMFLNGLPEEYGTMRDSLFSNIRLDRGLILSRLQQKESLLGTKASERSEATGESANRVETRNCFNCGKKGHIAKDCRAPRKERDESNERSKGRDSKRSHRGHGRSKGHGGRRGHEKSKARTADEESDTDSDSSKDSRGTSKEDACRVHLNERISDQFEHLLDRAYRAKGSDDPIIDSGATSTCSGKIELFESLDQRYGGSLGTAGKSMKIAGRGPMRIPLSSGKVARISNALYVPGMKQTLLSTQALYENGVSNMHRVGKGYQFFRKQGNILATGYNVGRTSYLGWVKDKNVLATKLKEVREESARLIKQIDWELIHRQLGHPGEERLRRMARKMGLTDKISDEAIEGLKTCETCIQAKSVKKQNHGPVPRASRPLKRVYMDFWGPYNKAKTKEGWRYYLSLTDDHTRFSWIYLTKDREAATVQKTLETWLAQAEREKGVKLLIIRTDNAKEFKALEPWALGQGIRIEFIEPDTPQQNGVAERLNRLLLEMTRAILIDADVPKEYWPYAIKMANYLRNRTIRVRGTKKTPFEIWMGHPPDLSKFRIPFCRVWFHRKTSDKMDPRAIEGVFIGYQSSKNHYMVMAKDRKIYRVTNPIFLENKRGFISKEPGVRDIRDEPAFQRIFEETTVPTAIGDGIGTVSNEVGVSGGAGSATREDVDISVEVGGSEPIEGDDSQSFELTNQSAGMNSPPNNVESPGSQRTVQRDSTSRSPQPDPSQPEPAGPAGPIQPLLQPSRTGSSSLLRSNRIRKPTQAAIESKQTEALYGRKPRAQHRREEREALRDPSPRLLAAEQQRIHEVANLAVALELHLNDHDAFRTKAKTEFNGQIPIPKTYEEAIRDPIYGSKWREAIRLELSNLIQFGTWRYVKRPKDQAVVSTKWVFDVKYTADGRIDRFKARLVARGFSQREGLDFEDTFAPVIRLESLRILFAFAATYGLKAHLLDATNAYVGSKIDKQIYMEIPEGIDPKSHDSNDVCEILQSLYGLRQSAYLWNQKVKGFVTSIGFRQSTADPGVFINDRGIIIALYVDDILIFGKDNKDIESIKEKLKRFHPMKDLGLAKKILGIRITWTKDSIRLDQEFYARSILEEFEMMNARDQDLPLNPSVDLNDESSRKLTRDLHAKFRQIIGRLTYLAGGTRPDIQFAVNRLSQHLADPRDVHLRASKHLLRYVKKTIAYGITYRAKGSEGTLAGYSDSSYGNATKCRSTSAYVFMMAGGPVSWCSRKQPITAMSTTEAEYIAAAEAAKHAIWIRHFLVAIQQHKILKGATQLGIDNQGALALASNPVNHLRSKHIRVRYHAIRDFIEHGDIKTTYIPTSKMAADGLTKAVKADSLKRMVESLQLE